MLFNFIALVSCGVVIDSSRVNESINSLQQDDPNLVNYIKEHLLTPPPRFPERIDEMDFLVKSVNADKDSEKYIARAALQAQYGQPLALEELFNPILKQESDVKRFFIEAGAYDGVTGSNTLRLQLNPVWQGLLVEPNPDSYESMVSRGRNAWTFPSCFSTKTTPETVQFDSADILSGIINEENSVKPGDGLRIHDEPLTLQCFPLYSILLALGEYFGMYDQRSSGYSFSSGKFGILDILAFFLK